MAEALSGLEYAITERIPNIQVLHRMVRLGAMRFYLQSSVVFMGLCVRNTGSVPGISDVFQSSFRAQFRASTL
jgi:hypothetical protein